MCKNKQLVKIPQSIYINLFIYPLASCVHRIQLHHMQRICTHKHTHTIHTSTPTHLCSGSEAQVAFLLFPFGIVSTYVRTPVVPFCIYICAKPTRRNAKPNTKPNRLNKIKCESHSQVRLIAARRQHIIYDYGECVNIYMYIHDVHIYLKHTPKTSKQFARNLREQ